MTTPPVKPEMSGNYEFQVYLRGSRLPVSFTISDAGIPGTPPQAPPSDELLDSDPGPSFLATNITTDQEAEYDATSNARTLSAHADTPDTITDIEVNKINLLSVSAYPITVVQPTNSSTSVGLGNQCS